MLSVLTLTLAVALPAADDPKAIIEKAIKATGGADVLKKYPAHRATFKGTVTAMGMDIEMKGEVLGVFPDKFKVKATINVAGQELPLEQTVNGTKFRMTIGGNELPVPDAQVADGMNTIYAASLSQLLTLLTADYTLAPAAEATVDGKKAVGVKASRKDRPDVTLHFDADTGRLVKTTHMGKAEDGSDAERETVYGDFREVKGLWVPHHETVTLGGKKTTDLTTEKYEPLEKLDASEFGTD